MKQSRTASFLESCGNTLSGFLISLLAQWLFLPAIGVSITLEQNLIFAVFMTFVSVGRGFAWRRLMEALHVRHPISPFMLAVIAERRRQIEVEGWDYAHDDAHQRGELAQAGAFYLAHAAYRYRNREPTWLAGLWPWEREWCKPDVFRRELVKGCALGVAEGEKYDRSRKPPVKILGGYQPEAGPDGFCWPPAPFTDSGVRPDNPWPRSGGEQLAHGKARSQHAGTSE